MTDTNNELRGTSYESGAVVIARKSVTAVISDPTEKSEEEKRRQYEALKERMTKAS